MIIKKKKIKIGVPPGTVEYYGTKTALETQIDILDISEDDIISQINVDKYQNYFTIPPNRTRLLHIHGLADLKAIEKLGTDFSLHPLVIEDIVSTTQRPKIEDYGDYIYVVLKLISFSESTEVLEIDQVSLVFGKNFIILIQETVNPVVTQVLKRFETIKSKNKKITPDYIAYLIIDAIVDSYFLTIENVGDMIENVEDEVFQNPKPRSLTKIYDLKREILEFKKFFWPLRDVLNKIQRFDSRLISESLSIYFRDIYDHIFRMSDTLENFRDIFFGLIEMYQSYQSNKMNDIMKTLTIISTVFIPLSFLAGFYGMNFQYMPELQYKWSYPILISCMLIIVGFMIFFFKKKKWI